MRCARDVGAAGRAGGLMHESHRHECKPVGEVTEVVAQALRNVKQDEPVYEIGDERRQELRKANKELLLESIIERHSRERTERDI